jgi:hypothetical protein
MKTCPNSRYELISMYYKDTKVKVYTVDFEGSMKIKEMYSNLFSSY